MSDEEAVVPADDSLVEIEVESESAPVEEALPGAATARRSLADLPPVRLATIVGLVVVAALVGLCGWLGFQVHQGNKQADARALFLQVGRQAALNLTTIDYEHVDADVKRILDSATGEFFDDFQKRSAPFMDVVKKSQSKSVGTITEAAIESVTGDESQVMVAVTVKTSNKAVPGEQPPRFWRMRLNIQKFGDEAKVQKVDFVP